MRMGRAGRQDWIAGARRQRPKLLAASLEQREEAGAAKAQGTGEHEPGAEAQQRILAA